MIRAARLGAALVLLGALAGCGGHPAKPTTGELLSRYFRSTHVRHDVDAGATSDDRLAEFAAEGGPSAVVSSMFAAYECVQPGSLNQDRSYAGVCPDGSAGVRARDFAGPDGTVYTRRILIRHHDGSLDLGTVYLPRKRGGGTELIDANGVEYHGLDDFRRRNTVLTGTDWIVTLERITALSGRGHLVTVTGHTVPDSRPWLSAGIAVAVLLLTGIAILVVRTVRRRRRPDPLLAQWPPVPPGEAPERPC